MRYFDVCARSFTGLPSISASIRKSSEKNPIRQAKRSMMKVEEDMDKQSEGTVYKAGDGFDQN